jgi:hypothetical protein
MTPKPTQAELGLDVTLAIVAITSPWHFFAHVSDRALSFDDILPSADNAIIKNIGLGADWSVTFAANDVKNVLPMLGEIGLHLSKLGKAAVVDVKKTFSDVFAETIRAEFLHKKLRKYGYSSFEHFRTEGRQDLGDHYLEVLKELNAENAADTTFIVYGYDDNNNAQLFEVSATAISDRRILRYAVIGSGYYMASASLRLKPMDFELGPTIYRLLSAKFSAETASGVGKSTTLTIKGRNRADWLLPSTTIERVREVWDAEMRKKEPDDAMSLLNGALSHFQDPNNVSPPLS